MMAMAMTGMEVVLVVVVVFVSALICGISHRRSRTGAHMCQLYPTVRCGYVASACIFHTLRIEGQRAAVQNRLCSVAAWRFSNRACESKGLQVFESWGVESVNFCQDHLPLSIQISGIWGLRSFLVTCSGFDQILLS